MSDMKLYQLNKPILLTNTAAAQLGVNNRIYQVGELMEFPDEMAKAWLKSGTISVYEVPAPAPVAKPQPKAPTPKKAAAKTDSKKTEEAK